MTPRHDRASVTKTTTSGPKRLTPPNSQKSLDWWTVRPLPSKADAKR